MTNRHFQLLRMVLNRERRLRLLATVIMLGSGAIFIWLMFCAVNTRLAIVCAVTSMALLSLGFKFLYETMTFWQAEHTTIWQLLKNRPQEIVWVYSELTETSPYGVKISNSGLLFFKLINGEQITLSVPAKYLHEFSSALNPALPHATFGYTDERAQWYIASPELLIRYE